MKREVPIWTPNPESASRTGMAGFLAGAAREEDPSIRDFASLHAWSVKEPARFWARAARACGILFDAESDRIVDGLDAMPGARWFPGARLNYARNLLRGDPEAAAIVFREERGGRRAWSRARLAEESARFAAGLLSLGLGAGDRVAAFAPNVPETVAAMLGASRIGAVWSSCAPEFGPRAALDRLRQIEPKVLLVADGYVFRGETVDVRAKAVEIAAGLPSLRAVVRIPYPSRAGPWGHTIDWSAFGGTDAFREFESLPFDHPLWVLYSSGTTGLPKGIVHGQGGALVQHAKEHRLHGDIRRGDVVFYYTTCGWMMWNWLVSALAAEATIVLWDGSPVHPGPDALWRLAEEEGVTHFGTSARWIAATEKMGVRPIDGRDLGALRTILSTGSPLAPEGFDYVYRDVKDNVLLASISGGTDIVSCFVLGNPISPVHRGEIQGPGLGMDVRILGEDGRELRRGIGELSCVLPFPAIPLGFWNDPDGQRFRKAYFERFPGVWCHGDFAERTLHGGFVIHGRSDATLNPGGVRIGTAEIYRIVQSIPEVLECVAVEQSFRGDTRVVLLVVMKDGLALSPDTKATIRRRLRDEASPRHVPGKIVAVADLPRTLSGKIVELAVRDVLAGREPANRAALANPEALDAIAGMEELRQG